MGPRIEEELVQFLKKNSDVFAWTVHDLEGINPGVMTLKLNANPTFRQICQKKRNFGIERNDIIRKEVEKLLAAGHIRPVQYPEWLANVVLVPNPTTKKEVQKLTGRMAALSRFLSPGAERGLPFFKTLRKMDGFSWNEEFQKAFDNLKEYLSKPPLLTKPRAGETLCVYLAASEEAVSAVLVRVEGKEHQPVYYVSKVLQGAEQKYPPIEKLALALIMAVRKLRPYFQSHQVTVLANQPLKHILASPNALGRMVKWAVELSEHDIEFEPRPAIKAQILADFILETKGEKDDKSNKDWTMFVDGSSTSSKSGVGIVMKSPEADHIEYAITLEFPFK
ncbi:UNVERIFIED_CONTAM: hypothetical protein Sradi_0170100 [Sesamum radiatum]|uniref:Reverse transcriptase/retrotransposon-derived protein RNase H-like domain-containing protein n=1 Tax=Sesamum radiatum TaxID=300843 RepID=A0AAW2VYH2_SESRA